MLRSLRKRGIPAPCVTRLWALGPPLAEVYPEAAVQWCWVRKLRQRTLLTQGKGGWGAISGWKSTHVEDLLPLTVPELRGLLREIVRQTAPPAVRWLDCSWWRRRRQLQAKRSHDRKRLARYPAETRL